MAGNNNCSCIKKEEQAFDFELSTYDCKAIIISDLTNWMVNDGYVIPDSYDVTIELPNSTSVVRQFKGNTTTKIYSKDLAGYNCLEDGIYCFKVDSCGYKYSRVKAVVCTLNCKLDDLKSKAQTKEEWGVVEKLSNSIKSIEVSAELGLELQAKEMFKITSKELDKHSCNCYCG